MTEYLTVGDLLKVIKDNNLSEDVKVYYQRIEDFYFDRNNWEVLGTKGDNYFRCIEHNKKIDLGKLVSEGKLDPDEVGEFYYLDKYADKRKYEDPEKHLDQYIEGFCCFYNEEHNILCITAHY